MSSLVDIIIYGAARIVREKTGGAHWPLKNRYVRIKLYNVAFHVRYNAFSWKLFNATVLFVASSPFLLLHEGTNRATRVLFERNRPLPREIEIYLYIYIFFIKNLNHHPKRHYEI